MSELVDILFTVVIIPPKTPNPLARNRNVKLYRFANSPYMGTEFLKTLQSFKQLKDNNVWRYLKGQFYKKNLLDGQNLVAYL